MEILLSRGYKCLFKSEVVMIMNEANIDYDFSLWILSLGMCSLEY